MNLPGVPFPLTPVPAAAWRADALSVTVIAPPRSDIFVDPGGPSSTLNAATLLGIAPDGDFQLSARVTVDFATTYDAGVLLLWVDEGRWAKLCFEFSPSGEPMVVSVVCRGVADDANAFVVAGRSVRLRASRIGPAYAYHACVDGQPWQLIRYFSIDDDATRALVGFEAQSPTGEGCSVTFDEIRFVSERLAHLRDGS
jgi:regulation of enolase protein 1 (concanavalin A-like superfamily)